MNASSNDNSSAAQSNDGAPSKHDAGDATSDSRVIRALHKRIALVFDFDETLAPNTTNALLEHVGVDAQSWRKENVEPRTEDGWEQRLAEAAALVELSTGDHGPIDDDVFAAVADRLELYPGVPEMFDRVRDAVAEIDADIEVEFHLCTAGFVNIPSHTRIASQFDSIIGGHWACNENGAIIFPKSTVGHYDKVRHLLALAKGLDSVHAENAWDIDRDIDEDDFHVPFEQIIFVGDGDSDLPAFDFMQSRSGTAIAVHQAESDVQWESRRYMRDGRQVAVLARSDFSEGGPLLRALTTAAQRCAMWIRLVETNDTDR